MSRASRSSSIPRILSSPNNSRPFAPRRTISQSASASRGTRPNRPRNYSTRRRSRSTRPRRRSIRPRRNSPPPGRNPSTPTTLLRKKQKDLDLLAKKLTDATTAADDLARLVRKKDDERVVMVKQTAEMQKILDDLDAKLLAAKKDLASSNAGAKSQMKDLLKKLDEASATIIDLQGDKAKLADKYDKFQKDAETRFAGIVTSGRRVVFLVDISGSMAKRDAETADSTKWPIVVETIGKVMRSLPALEKYQVVVFSSSAKWLFGNGEWQDYTGEKSIETVKSALLAEKPYDDTNLNAGLEKAFTLRNSGGLDAIYLFSDGLPTSGPGLTFAEQNRQPPLAEIERGEKLGKYIRRTLSNDWNRPLTGKPRVKIHAIGFFFESPDVGAFLWALARENEGSFVGMSKP